VLPHVDAVTAVLPGVDAATAVLARVDAPGPPLAGTVPARPGAVSRVLAAGVAGALVCLLAAFVWAGNVSSVASAFLLLVTPAMLANSVLTATRMIYGWQTPERVNHVDLDDIAAPQLSFTVLVPARHEADHVLSRTYQRILESDYPQQLVQVIAIVGHDDPDTTAIAQRFSRAHRNFQVVIDYNAKKSKPAALETARPYCTGDLVTIVDAESLISVKLLAVVNTFAVRCPGTAMFQGGVQLMNIRATPRPGGSRWRRIVANPGRWLNADTSWWRLRNCMEYYVWFMSRLRFQAEQRFIPLGGNTVFVRRGVLNEADGWDADCLTEDCELGVRLSARGHQATVFYHPDLTTMEETPGSLSKLIVQRTRWNMGFLQVLRAGQWRKLPTLRQRYLAVEMLTMPLFQASAAVLVPASLLVAVLVKVPTMLVLWTWTPVALMILIVALEHAAFREFCDAYGIKPRATDTARLVASTLLYQWVLAAAAVRAVIRLATQQTEWELTAHTGAHLGSPLAAPAAAAETA
jgi:Glycosyltransferases, probably involved in cell wall biogenesis